MIALPVGGGIAGVFGVVGITVAVLSVVWLQKRKKSSIQCKEHMCITCLCISYDQLTSNNLLY